MAKAHSTAGFKSLMLGSIGVVYGDIGTSPLYALREALIAAGGHKAPGIDNPKPSSACSR
jgi:KUP system potassium uptake protein